MDEWGGETITEGSRALDLFVNRHQLCRLFLSYLNDDPPRSSILYFHGDGGNGKSLLLDYFRTRLCKRIEPDNWSYLRDLDDAECISQVEVAADADDIPIGRLDFSQPRHRDPFEALLKLRRDFAEANLRFLLFDFAVLTYLHKSGQLNEERVRTIFPAQEIDLVLRTAQLFAEVPGGGLALAVLNLADQRLGAWFRRYRLRRNLSEDQVAAIQRMDHEKELIDELPRLFARDLNASLGDPDAPARAALLFDTHEAFWGHERELVGDSYFGRNEWLRRMLSTLDRTLGATVVVTGRERPRWTEATRFPLSDVDVQLVGDLPFSDALVYLEQVGITDAALRMRLCEDARVAADEVHPLYLGLGADLALAAIRMGSILTDRDLGLGAGAENRRQRLVDRLLRYVGAEIRDAVCAVSVCRSFDVAIYQYLGQKLGFLTSRAGFEILTGFSFVRRGDGEQYWIHELLRRLLGEQHDALVRAAHAAMEPYYRRRAKAGSEAAVAEAIYHANRLNWRRGSGEWFVVFDAAFRTSQLGLCRSLLEIRDEFVIEMDAAAGLMSVAAAQYLHRLSRYEEARSECLEAITAFDRGLAESPNEPEFLSNKGNALVLLGEVEVALNQQESAEDRFRAASDAFGAALAGDPENFTYLSNHGKALLKLGELQAAASQRDAADESYLNAEAAIRAALQRAEGEASLYNNLGMVEMHLADLRAISRRRAEAETRYRSSITALNAALRLAPDDPLIHNNRGSAFYRRANMYAKQGRRVAAQRSYRAAIAATDAALGLAPEYLLALSNKGTYCEELGWLFLVWARPQRIPDARRLFQAGLDAYEKAASIAPDDATYREAAARLRNRLAEIAG